MNKFSAPHVGGIERHLDLLSRGLASRPGIEPRILTCNQGFSRYSSTDVPCPTSKAASLGQVLSMPISLQFPWLLRKAKADILHFHHPFPLGEVSQLLMGPHRKYIVTWHSDIIRQRRLAALYRPILLRFLRRAEAIVVGSPNYLDVSSYLPAFREKCRVIPYGIEVDSLSCPSERVLEEAEGLRSTYGDRLVLFVGRLVRYKGIPYLVEAMKSVEGRLLIIGDGPLLKTIQSQIHTLGLDDKVRICSHVTDGELVSYYHASRLLVLPSISINESFGLVQLEAMACGKPVVSTSLPTGVTYANLNGQTGLTVPPGDSPALAQAIATLLDDSDLAARLGAQGRQRVHAEFQVDKMVSSVEALYRELVA